jgi:hypothetical protein
MRLKPEFIVQLINPLAKANGNIKKKKKPEVVRENIYCRRFQPTEQRTRFNEMALAKYYFEK